MTYNLEIDAAAVVHEFRGLVPTTTPMTLTLQATLSSTGGTSSNAQLDDIVWSNFTGATTILAGVVDVIDQLDTRFRTLTPSIATVDENGIVTRAANGTARIAVQCPTHGGCINVPVSQATGQSSRTFVNYDAASLGQALRDEILPLLSGKTYASHAAIFSGGNWNTNNWAIAGGIDLSCLSYSNSRFGSQGGATLIHPRIAVVADHWHANVGQTYTWKTPANEPITRTITGYYHVTTHGSGNDIGLVLLDSAVPETIAVAKLLPANWGTYLPSLYTSQPAGVYDAGFGIPWLSRNQFNELFIQGMVRNDFDPGSLSFRFCNSNETALTSADAIEFFRYAVAGDSSNGCCLVEPETQRLILATAYLNPHGGMAMTTYIAAVETGMNSLLTGATPVYADFSSYPAY